MNLPDDLTGRRAADIKASGGPSASPPGEPLANTLDAARELASGTGPLHQSRFNEVFGYLERMSTPSIAVVDGICTTGGLELILACDLQRVLNMIDDVGSDPGRYTQS